MHQCRKVASFLASTTARIHCWPLRASLLNTRRPPLCRVFGWTRKNEINNGRWVMMGIGIGLMTEYATGVSFIDQLKLMASYLGLVDLE